MLFLCSENAESPRKELLHNIDILYQASGNRLYPDTFDTRTRAAIRVGDYKLITGDPGDIIPLSFFLVFFFCALGFVSGVHHFCVCDSFF